MNEMETFEIGGGIGDIGGEEIDLKNLDLTNTLIGSCAAELTQALGEADTNVWEQYHMGDGGIADIELTAFDSALIQDSGIRPYTADPAAQTEDGVDSEVSELAEILGKKKPKVMPKDKAPEAVNAQTLPKAFHDLVAGILEETNLSASVFNETAQVFANDARYPWQFDDLHFNEKGEFDEAEDSDLMWDEKDFDAAEKNWRESEYQALVDDIAGGELPAIIKDPEFKLVSA